MLWVVSVNGVDTTYIKHDFPKHRKEPLRVFLISVKLVMVSCVCQAREGLCGRAARDGGCSSDFLASLSGPFPPNTLWNMHLCLQNALKYLLKAWSGIEHTVRVRRSCKWNCAARAYSDVPSLDSGP